MRKFDQDLSCFGTERRHNFVIYGRESRYIPFELKYEPDIRLLCLKSIMSSILERDRKYEIYAFAIHAVSEGFFPLLDVCLDYDKADCETHEVSKHIVRRFKQEFDMIEDFMDEMEEVKDKMQKTTKDDVINFAKRYINDNFSITVLKPKK